MSKAKFEFGDRVWHADHGEGVIGECHQSRTGDWIYGVSFRVGGRGGYGDNELVPYTPPPPPNTVPVRVPVFFYKDGSWRVPHWDSDYDPKKIVKIPNAWITAHVPLPAAPAEVEGRVE